MYKRKRAIKAALLVLLTGICLVGCEEMKGGSLETEMKVEMEPIELIAPTISEEDLIGNQNLLTGLNDLSDEAIGKRPVSVMVNNIKDALPQYGVAEADVIFEIPVEGNQTRLMTIYADYTKVPYICSVRSCRDYFPAFAKGFDAYYVHWGQDPTIVDYLYSLKMDRFNGMDNTGGLYGRDASRRSAGYSLEHTSYFDGTKIVDAINKLGMRTELLDAKQGTAFKFHEVGAVVAPSGDACSQVYVNFGAQNSTFNYDESTNTYFKKHGSNAHIDARTGEQLSFTNVFVLETSISTRDAIGHKSVNWRGGSSAVGYYVSNGVVQKISWSKSSESDYLKFYDANGEELAINRGKSFIAVCSRGQASFQ